MQPVAFGVTRPAYNREPPFHPDTRFPELPFEDVSAEPNGPYALLRQLFVDLGLDRERHGTAPWNPLGQIIRPGQTVLLKPNFVTSFNGGGGDLFAMVTHPSVLRALVDYVFLALQGRGRIVIADTPEMSCQWESLMAAQRLEAIQAWYRERFHFAVECYDLRDWTMVDPLEPAYASNRAARPGDPAGRTLINLGPRSAFYGLPSENYYGADYDRAETIRHHHGEVHEYWIANTFLRADVVISVPKMKVHKKVGVTLNLKGLVGVTTNKNCLVHYRLGTPREGGDQLPDPDRGVDRLLVKARRWASDHLLARQSRTADAIYQAARKTYRATVKPFLSISHDTLVLDGGNWHGNDSAWRMTADLAKILFFADAAGELRDTPQRKMFCVVDGIVGGDRLGPLEPDAHPCGCLVAGWNPFAVDLVTTRLMGFDPRKLRQLDLAFDPGWDFGLHSFDDIEVRHHGQIVAGGEFFSPDRREPHFAFTPHPGWRGHIEI